MLMRTPGGEHCAVPRRQSDRQGTGYRYNMNTQISFPFKSSSLDNSVQDQLIKVRRKKLLGLKFVRKFHREFTIDHNEQVISYKTVKTELCGVKREKVKNISFMDIVGARKG